MAIWIARYVPLRPPLRDPAPGRRFQGGRVEVGTAHPPALPPAAAGRSAINAWLGVGKSREGQAGVTQAPAENVCKLSFVDGGVRAAGLDPATRSCLGDNEATEMATCRNRRQPPRVGRFIRR